MTWIAMSPFPFAVKLLLYALKSQKCLSVSTSSYLCKRFLRGFCDLPTKRRGKAVFLERRHFHDDRWLEIHHGTYLYHGGITSNHMLDVRTSGARKLFLFNLYDSGNMAPAGSVRLLSQNATSCGWQLTRLSSTTGDIIVVLDYQGCRFSVLSTCSSHCPDTSSSFSCCNFFIRSFIMLWPARLISHLRDASEVGRQSKENWYLWFL